MEQNKHHTLFWTSYTIALLVAMLIFVIFLALSLSGLGAPPTPLQKVISFIVLFIIFLPIPMLVYFGALAYKRKILPSWLKITMWSYFTLFLATGFFSMVVDYSDFFWSGLPILFCCGALGICLAKYPKETQ